MKPNKYNGAKRLSTQLTLGHLEIKSNPSLQDFALPQYSSILANVHDLIFGQLNELYLFGDARSGKTYLLSAIYQEYVATYAHQGRLAMFLSVKELLASDPQMLTGLEQFSLILVDDIELLANHKEWQTALFHLINQMRRHQHKLVFSASVPVRELEFELLDLLTRLSQAVSIPIPYSEESNDRLAITNQLLKKQGWRLPHEVKVLLSEVGPYHIGDILTVLEKLAPKLATFKPHHKLSKKTLTQIKNAIAYQSFMLELADFEITETDDETDNNLTLPI